jgi:hypothetical protein
MYLLRPVPFLLGALAGVLSACATSSRDGDFTSASADGGGTFVTDSSVPTTPQGEVYGHSDTVLYAVSTGTRAVREIGSFQGCTHVADIALDESSNMYASTGAELWLIENNTARCTRIAAGAFPNSLSFVPAGTVQPGKETLVGFQGGDYVKIDPATGKVEKIGALGGAFESSGDLVSVKGGKTFLTVKGPDCADCLVEIDPATGKLTKNWGSLGTADAFGLAYWAGDLYAFTDGGEVILVKLVGDKLETTVLSVPNAPKGLAFRGAGSTTSAPVGPVK